MAWPGLWREVLQLGWPGQLLEAPPGAPLRARPEALPGVQAAAQGQAVPAGEGVRPRETY